MTLLCQHPCQEIDNKEHPVALMASSYVLTVMAARTCTQPRYMYAADVEVHHCLTGLSCITQSLVFTRHCATHKHWTNADWCYRVSHVADLFSPLHVRECNGTDKQSSRHICICTQKDMEKATREAVSNCSSEAAVCNGAHAGRQAAGPEGCNLLHMPGCLLSPSLHPCVAHTCTSIDKTTSVHC